MARVSTPTKVFAAVAGLLLAGELAGAVALGGFPAEVSVRTAPPAVTSQQNGVSVRTLPINFRNFDDETHNNLYFEIDRIGPDGKSTQAQLVGATGSCFANGNQASANIFSWLPFAERKCTVSYLAPGGPETIVVKFQHRSGIPIAPIWFGNQTVQHEAPAPASGTLGH